MIAKGTIDFELATAHAIRKRIAALKHAPLPDIAEPVIATLEPLAAALEAFELAEQVAATDPVRFIRPDVEVWQ